MSERYRILRTTNHLFTIELMVDGTGMCCPLSVAATSLLTPRQPRYGFCAG